MSDAIVVTYDGRGVATMLSAVMRTIRQGPKILLPVAPVRQDHIFALLILAADRAAVSGAHVIFSGTPDRDQG